MEISLDEKLYSREIETAAEQYEEKILPPFFKTLSDYVEKEIYSLIVQDIKVVNIS